MGVRKTTHRLSHASLRRFSGTLPVPYRWQASAHVNSKAFSKASCSGERREYHREMLTLELACMVGTQTAGGLNQRVSNIFPGGALLLVIIICCCCMPQTIRARCNFGMKHVCLLVDGFLNAALFHPKSTGTLRKRSRSKHT